MWKAFVVFMKHCNCYERILVNGLISFNVSRLHDKKDYPSKIYVVFDLKLQQMVNHSAWNVIHSKRLTLCDPHAPYLHVPRCMQSLSETLNGVEDS